MNTAFEKPAATPLAAPPMPLRALMILALGLAAAWLAAGSLGWLAPPLQKALTWLALATIVIAAIPGRRRLSRNETLMLGGAGMIALLMTAASSPVVNILAVATLLAAIAQVRRGMVASASGSVAVSVVVLAVFRLACDSSAATWTLANIVGRCEGFWAAWLTGRPLRIGASFGGLDFLVLMGALTAAWLITTPQPRIARAAWALLLIFLAQTAYLVVLAFNHDVAAWLPPQVTFKQDDISHLGIWTWGNAIRSLLPWNLPVLAAVLHGAVAIGMFRLSARRATAHDLQSDMGENSALEGRRRSRSLQSEPSLSSDRWNSSMQWRRFGPAGLMVVAAVAMTLAPVKPDLSGRRIVSYDAMNDAGAADPEKLSRHVLLQALVESLDGTFASSTDLSDAVLQNADVLIVMPRSDARTAVSGASFQESIPSDLRERIWRYVSSGGRLVVAGEPETNLGVEENVLNDLLTPYAMSFRDDTANALTQRWEDDLQWAPHAATASSHPGRNHFSLDRAASIRVSWPAGPLVVGRWAWDELGTDVERPEALPYSPGDHLGDLVLAAQQNVGQGKVVVLGSAGCLRNDGIPFSYQFIGPLLSALASNIPTPLVWWRQLLGLAMSVAAIALLFRQIEPVCVAAASIGLSLALIACSMFSNATTSLLPMGTKGSARPVIYVDGSHLGAMSKDPWGENGVGRLMRVLASNGYLPLMAPDLSLDRLKRAAMLISIAPGKAFSSGDIAAVHDFVAQGGFFLSMVGSPEAKPSRALLESLQLHIKPTPVPPWIQEPETTPLGAFWYPSEEQQSEQFYAAWPVYGPPAAPMWSKPVIVGSRIEGGQAYLIGDTAFALNKNLEATSPNVNFWSSQLKSWLGQAGDKSATMEPGEGGILNLPKPKKEKGVKP